MTLIEELEQWKVDLKELEGEKIKAEAKLEQAMEGLKDLGFDSVEEAEIKRDELIAQREIAETGARELIEQFKEKYAKFIE